jgi:DNA-binding winged helix-turn-helix (wHTH) protein/tetratricopeptide (TPR) repeat protein
MDARAHPTSNSLLTTAEMAAREDFNLGEARVSPSTRVIHGPGGQAELEPRVMQVLMVLSDAAGSVVTRETLFDRCWGNSLVGDDSLNRAIAGVRRVAENVAAESFEIETVPRTGYRLIVKSGAKSATANVGEQPTITLERGSTRRALVAGAATCAATLGIGGWIWIKDRPDPRFEELMERGEDAIRLDEPATKYFEQAVVIEPRKARALGLLAYALASGRDMGPSTVASSTAQVAERAARTALEIDPKEPNALLTMTIVQIGTRDRYAGEEDLRRILAIAPNNTLAMRWLRQLLHGAGRCDESLAIGERALAIEPLCPDHRLRNALQLWIHGRVPEADRIIDHAMELWPAHRLVRMARLMIYAFTGRTKAALAIVEEEEKSPIFLSDSAISVWRASLEALETRTGPAIAAALKANVEGAKATPAIAAYGIVMLSALGELDAAFAVANGFLLGRGSVIVQPKPDPKVPSVSNWGWRNTHGLWTPPAKPMRLDPRFKSLADGFGLTVYWRKRGIGPDDFLFRP